MSSIILSFVGNQDPFSDQTEQEGSIVTLVKHLLAQTFTIKQVFLLHTTDTTDRAELTQAWLGDVPLQLPQEAIALIPVDPALSDDPVNTALAAQAARQGLERAIAQRSSQDWLEFNASSGTPVMKSAWSLLQAAGYIPRSRVWQVRNPREQKAHQSRVFQANVQFLRQEFDARVIKQQLQDYNYAGARTTLNASGLGSAVLEALLDYGHYRLSLDFQRARAAIAPVEAMVDDCWRDESHRLGQRETRAILREVYFNAVLELKNQKFADFLVRVSQFQEKTLHSLVGDYLANGLQLPRSFQETGEFWQGIATQQPDLYHFLQTYRYRNQPLRLESFPSRPVLMAIVAYHRHPALEVLQTLNSEYEQRNRYIHDFQGISELDGADMILRTMRQVLEQLGEKDFTNPFNRLNGAIGRSLDAALNGTLS